MPWNEADRAKYEVILDRYSTDMSDAEFELISPLLPPPKKLGRKPTDFRVVLNAVFYMIRVGCLWRLLPKDFPPFTTVQNRFYAWRDSGLWPQIISVIQRRAYGLRDEEYLKLKILICGRPPLASTFLTFQTIWSTAVICPACWRGAYFRWP